MKSSVCMGPSQPEVCTGPDWDVPVRPDELLVVVTVVVSVVTGIMKVLYAYICLGVMNSLFIVRILIYG